MKKSASTGSVFELNLPVHSNVSESDSERQLPPTEHTPASVLFTFAILRKIRAGAIVLRGRGCWLNVMLLVLICANLEPSRLTHGFFTKHSRKSWTPRRVSKNRDRIWPKRNRSEPIALIDHLVYIFPWHSNAGLAYRQQKPRHSKRTFYLPI